MSSKNEPKGSELRTDLTTTNTDPLAPARLAPKATRLEAGGRAAFDGLFPEGGFDSLPEGGKHAFRALSQVDEDDDRFPGALRAALDAVRDARAIGLFNPAAPPSPQHITESKDPAVRNQSPTGTVGESAGTASVTTATPSAPPPPASSNPETPAPAVVTSPAAPVKPEPNTTTPAVKGSSKS